MKNLKTKCRRYFLYYGSGDGDGRRKERKKQGKNAV